MLEQKVKPTCTDYPITQLDPERFFKHSTSFMLTKDGIKLTGIRSRVEALRSDYSQGKTRASGWSKVHEKFFQETKSACLDLGIPPRYSVLKTIFDANDAHMQHVQKVFKKNVMLTKLVELVQLLQMKDKKVLVGVLAAVILLLGAGGYMLFANKSSVPTGPEEQIEEYEEISAEELGLTITVKPDKKYVKFGMTNVQDITHVEWEFLYDADIPKAEIPEGETGGKVTQQIIGDAEIESGADSFESEYRELGSCSTGGKCRFDTGVEKIDLVVKITKKDGKMYQSKTSTSL